MQRVEYEYRKLVQEVLLKGEDRETRNVATRSIFGTSLSFDLRESFPLLEGRKIFYKGVLGELAALLREPKHVDDFKRWGCNYWDAWADPDGNLTVDYGNAWFDFEGVDQIAELKAKLRNNPADRRMVINAWRPHKLEELSLPCCHYSYQFHVSPSGVLNMVWTQRSADLMIGVPSDMVLAAAWMIAIATEFGFTPGVCKMDFGDTHIYVDHIDPAYDYLTSSADLIGLGEHPYVGQSVPKWKYLPVEGTDFCTFEPEDLEILNYNPLKTIKFNLHA